MAIDPQVEALHQVFLKLASVKRHLLRILSSLRDTKSGIAEMQADVTALQSLATQVPPPVKTEVEGLLTSQSVQQMVADTQQLFTQIETYSNKYGA